MLRPPQHRLSGSAQSYGSPRTARVRPPPLALPAAMVRFLRRTRDELRAARAEVDTALASLRASHDLPLQLCENAAVAAIIRLNRARDLIRRAGVFRSRRVVRSMEIAGRIRRGHTKWVLIHSFCYRTFEEVREVREVNANDVCHEISGERDQDHAAYALWKGTPFKRASWRAVD